MKRRISATILLIAVLAGAGSAFAWGPVVTLIEPTTAAATKEFVAPEGLGSSLQLTGVLGVGETITLQRYNGTTWEALKIDGSDAPSLSSTNHIITIYGAMAVRLSKPETAAAAGVEWRR